MPGRGETCDEDRQPRLAGQEGAIVQSFEQQRIGRGASVLGSESPLASAAQDHDGLRIGSQAQIEESGPFWVLRRQTNWLGSGLKAWVPALKISAQLLIEHAGADLQ